MSKMDRGIIEQIIIKEVGKYNSDVFSWDISMHYKHVFTELKTDVLLAKDKIASIYLGPLIRNHPDRYARENQKQNLSNGKREIKIEVNSYYSPIIGSWLKNGFELFGKLKEKNIRVEWGHCLERIRKFPKSKDITDLADDFKDVSGRKMYYSYSDVAPLFSISDDIKSVKRFVCTYKEAINLDEAMLKNASHEDKFTLSIGRNLLDFSALGTNEDSIIYAGFVDEFLREDKKG